MAFNGELKESRKESVTLPDFYGHPIHKRISDFKRFSDEQMSLLKTWLKLEISVVSLRKLQKSMDDNPTPFELKVINTYWSCGKGHFNRKISEIQIASENPHIIKALKLYNDLRKKNQSERLPRTLKDISNMGYVARQQNRQYNINNSCGKSQMQCDSYDKGIRSSYYLTLNTIWAKSGFEASSKAIINTISNDALPIGAIYKEYSGGSLNNRLAFARHIDALEIPAYECPACSNARITNPVAKVSVLGYSDKANVNSNPINNRDRILLVKPHHKYGDVKDFYPLVAEGLNELSSRVICCSDGIINSLIDLLEGFDINMTDVPIGESTLEDFLLNANSKYVVVIAKHKNLVQLKERLKSLQFDVFPIGKVTSKKYYRLINEDVELMKLSSSIAKYHIHDYSIFRIEDRIINTPNPLYLKFDKEKKGEYFRKNLALGRFIANNIFSGVSSGQTLYPPLLGRKQLTPMHVLAVAPSASRFEDACAMITSNINAPIGNNDFSLTVNAVVSAVMKLVVLGVPLSSTAVSCNFLYEINATRTVRGAVLAKSLACLYAENSLSVGTMGNSIELMKDMKADGIVSDVTAVGACGTSDTVTNLFKKGDKLYHFRIPRDDYDIPDFKYILKLASQINMYINMGDITSGRVIDYNVADSVIKGTAGDKLGFSFAKIDETTFENRAGDILLAVNDESCAEALNGKYIGVVDDTGDIKGADISISQDEIEKKVSKYPFENNQYLRVQKIVPDFPRITQHASQQRINVKALILHNEDSAERNFAEALNKAGYQVSSIKLPAGGVITSGFAVKLREQIVATDLLVCAGRSYSGVHDEMYNVLHNPVVLDALNEHLFNHSGLVLCTGEGARAFLELGYLACGNAELGKPKNLELITNENKEPSARLPRVIINSGISPFLRTVKRDKSYIAASAGSRLKLNFTEEVIKLLSSTGQIAMQFVDYFGYPTMLYPDNPYGSLRGVAAISSPNGRILGLFVQPELTMKLKGEASLVDEMLRSALEYFTENQ